MSATGTVISHTTLVVPHPWDEAFEAAWSAPRGAISASLLRGPKGQYVAEAEWASRADCESWMAGPIMESVRATTTVFERRREEAAVARQPASASAKETGSRGGAFSSAPSADLRSTLDRISAGARESATLGSSGEDPEMDEEEELMMAGGDPSFLDDSLWSSPESAKQPVPSKLGSSGEDPEMDEEDELMMAGGDPSFLDDSLWSSPASAKESAPSKLGSSGEDPEMDEEEEIMMAGGDPSFLDDSAWGVAPKKNVVGDAEWDGIEDDTAHLDG